MIEKEFRDLSTQIEMSSNNKKEISSFIKLVNESIDSNISKSIKINEFVTIPEVDEVNNYENKFNVFINLFFKTKNLPLELALEVGFNEIINGILLNIKNNIIYKDEMPIIKKDYEHYRLIFNFSTYTISFYLIFKKDNIIKSNLYKDNTSCFTDNLNVYREFLKKGDKKYNRFKQVLSVISKFRFDLKQSYEFNDYLIDAILLYYGLDNYEFDNNIIDYLKVYTHAINDLIDGKEIILTDDLYKEFNVLGINTPKDNFKIIDISNKLNNLISEYESLKKFKDLKSLIVSKFPKDGLSVVIDITPAFVIKDSSICWGFKIEDTDISNKGGEYEYNLDNYYSCIYKGMLKGLQFVVKNKLGNNITFKIEKSMFSLKDAFPNQSIKEDMEKLSYENQSRYANVLNYAKDFDLGIEYKII